MAAIRNRTQELIMVPANKLRPNEKNWRRHPESQRKALEAILQEVGFVGATLVRRLPKPDTEGREYELVDGHLRAETGGDEELPCLVVDLNDEEADKVLATFDPLGSLASTDETALAALLASIECDTPAMDALLKEVAEQYELPPTAPAAQGDPDEVPDVPVVPTTETGDLWILGEHRLLCGDSTNADDVELLMDGHRAGLMNTDPPYGIAYANDDRPNPGVAKPRVAKPRVANDELSDQVLQAFLEKAFGAAVFHALTPNAAWYLWHAHLTQGYFAAAAAAANVVLHRQIIWVKPVLLLGRGQYHWKHEPCFMGWVRGHQPPDYGEGNGERTQTTVWEIGSISQAERRTLNHSSPKPTGLFTIPLVKHLNAGEICYEPFAGSGPQFIAAEQLGRRCFGMELEAQYCDVIAERYFKFCGKMPILEATGETFAQVKERRAAEKPVTSAAGTPAIP